MQSQPECFSSLSQDQQIALAETDSRINWFLKEETIHGLLKFPSITLSTLKYVESQLSVPTPYAGYPTSIVLPFEFVKNYAESREIFMKELEKDSCLKKNGKYQMKRVGDYFYVCEDTTYNMGEEASYSNNASPIATDNVQIPVPDSDSLIDTDANDDFCDGLGISISQHSEKYDDDESSETEEEEEEYTDETIVPIDKRPLYWLILIPHERYMQIYFYSKIQSIVAGFEILGPIKEKIKVVQQRTNRLVLLNSLQETRVCR